MFLAALSVVCGQEVDVSSFIRKAQGGNPEAQSALGYAYYYGDGVKRDFGKARKWWVKASGNGSSEAEFALGCSY